MIQVNPSIMMWARETAGLTFETAARKLAFRDTQKATAVEKLKQLEDGLRKPSSAVLSKMSLVYRRPLLTFYLAEIPSAGDKVEDYRTLPADTAVENDSLVNALVRDIKARQSIVKSVLVDEDEADPVSLFNSCNIQQAPEAIAHKITGTLGFDIDAFREEKDVKEAFKYLRTLVESAGIYVLLMGNLGSHHTNIPASVFRGFILSDSVAPFVIINDLDSPSAWSFTLLHELAHLALGQTGISGGYSEQKIEKLCNIVASRILLPSNDMNAIIFDYDSLDSLCLSISRASKDLNISNRQIAYRLLLAGKITKADWLQVNDHFDQLWQAVRARQREKNRAQDGGPNPYILKRNKMGSLVHLMKRMNATGAITATKAGKVLGTRAIKVHKLFDAVKTTGTV